MHLVDHGVCNSLRTSRASRVSVQICAHTHGQTGECGCGYQLPSPAGCKHSAYAQGFTSLLHTAKSSLHSQACFRLFEHSPCKQENVSLPAIDFLSRVLFADDAFPWLSKVKKGSWGLCVHYNEDKQWQQIPPWLGDSSAHRGTGNKG